MEPEILQLIPLLKKKYEKGENLINFITGSIPGKEALKSAINVSYDIQAGSYVANFHRDPAYYEAYLSNYAEIINSLGPVKNIVEAGVGEATTLIPLLPRLNYQPEELLGFDSSWSRISVARKFASERKVQHANLVVGNFFNCPLNDNSADLVFTSHAVEPNGGLEREALQELYRITRKFLVLFEPIYEFADEAGKERMDRLGYVKSLRETAQSLGYEIVRHELLTYNKDLSNPTGVIVIRKNQDAESQKLELCDPVSKLPLNEGVDCLFNTQSGLAYPKILGIPCLKVENAIVVTKILEHV